MAAAAVVLLLPPTQQVWHYNWLDMLADLGGLLGLLLGASCLSMSQAVLSWVEEKMKKY